MTMAQYSVTLFALLNAARTVAYLPQIVRIYRDPNGAKAVSVMTWLLFASANVATVAYAVFVSGDWLVATIFCLNTVGSGVVALMTLARRLKAVTSAAARSRRRVLGAASLGRPKTLGVL